MKAPSGMQTYLLVKVLTWWKGLASPLFSFTRALMTPITFQRHHMITFGIRMSTYEFWGNINIQTIAIGKQTRHTGPIGHQAPLRSRVVSEALGSLGTC